MLLHLTVESSIKLQVSAPTVLPGKSSDAFGLLPTGPARCLSTGECGGGGMNIGNERKQEFEEC
jgi:hypothetical protein